LQRQIMPPDKVYGMLERYEGKLSRTVLRRGGGSNLSFLFGKKTKVEPLKESSCRISENSLSRLNQRYRVRP
jgi:hypothetical protein